MTEPTSLRALADAEDYDPASMPVERARQNIRRFLTPIRATERVHLREALGRVLAADILAGANVPAAANSAMDGYALRFADLAADGPTTLRVQGSSFAGHPHLAPAGAGIAVRIMTGGLLPPDCDTVVMQERVQRDGDSVQVPAGARQGQNVRHPGDDIRAGQNVFARGRLLRPADVGMLASLGVGEVTVYRRLRVSFFSTGDELVSLGSTPGPGQIYDSNRHTLHALLTRMGAEARDLGVVADDPAAIEAAFRQAAADSDVVITSGGVSVGEADFVREMLARLGEVLFWKVAMKPGRPLAFGHLGGAHFFGLPGNPVSAMVTFYQFVREALLVLMGVPDPAPVPRLRARCTTPIRKAPGRTEFQRGVLAVDTDGNWSVRSTGDQGSGILSSMGQANCFIVLSAEQGDLPAGSTVEVEVLEGFL